MGILKKGAMIPGQRYRGYGFINEFQEFCFEPENKGAHAGRVKAIFTREGISVSETKNLIMIKFNLEKKGSKLEYLQELTRVYNYIFKFLQDYDI